MVDPRGMCRKHLLGEHNEIHMFVGSLRAKTSVGGYIKKGLLEIHRLEERHIELAQELKHRGYQHESPLNFTSRNPKFEFRGYVDARRSYADLHTRCATCKARFKRILGKGKSWIQLRKQVNDIFSVAVWKAYTNTVMEKSVL